MKIGLRGADTGLVSWWGKSLPRQRSIVDMKVWPTTFTLKQG